MTHLIVWSTVALAAALPTAYLTVGDVGAVRVFVAFVLCLSLTAVSLRFILWALPRGGNWALASVLGGSFVRMILVLTLATSLFWIVPVLGSVGFLLWVTLFYLLTLALEVWQAVDSLKRLQAAPAVAT